VQIKNSSLLLRDSKSYTKHLKMSEYIFLHAVVQNLEAIDHSMLLVSSDDYICKET
jgi:glycosylphosphatidylinositol transamidase (GPIT) subunit GPI8